MITILSVFQVLVSLGLIGVVLLQSSKGEGLGSIGGGGQIFHNKNKGLDDLLSKLTSVTAVLFIVLSVVLTVLYM